MNRRRFVELGLSGPAGAALSSCRRTVTTAVPPEQGLAQTAAFEAKEIPTYQGIHTSAYQYIDQHLDDHLGHIRRWVRQPSVGAEGRGIQEMAAMVVGDLGSLGFHEVELIKTSGHPGIWGYYDAKAKATLAVYIMYDVQPAEPADWQVNPFDGAVVATEFGRTLVARGASNSKGPERAFLNAVEAILAAEGTLPVNLMVVVEGEEELGSPHFGEIIDRYGERLRSSVGVLFPSRSQGPDGRVALHLGFKGTLTIEFEATGGPAGGPTMQELHSSLKAVVDSPTQRLIEAIASLTDRSGNTVVIPGYHDRIRPPSTEERRLVEGILKYWDDKMFRESLGVSRWVNGVTGRDMLMRYLYETTINVQGIQAGYNGPGPKTVLPARATAKIDSRLVPDQDPDESVRLIRNHLDTLGFNDIKMRVGFGSPPSQTSVSDPFIRSTIGVFNKYMDRSTVWPRHAGGAPTYHFNKRLGLPFIFGGLGHGGKEHAPNEYFVIDPKPGSPILGLAGVERSFVDMLYAYSTLRSREGAQ